MTASELWLLVFLLSCIAVGIVVNGFVYGFVYGYEREGDE